MQKKAAKLIYFIIFNTKFSQETLWLISSEWKHFQNSKTKACIGNIDRELITKLKICYSSRYLHQLGLKANNNILSPGNVMSYPEPFMLPY